MAAKLKEVWFWKIKVENEVGTCWSSPPRAHFWTQTFSSRASRKLSMHTATRSKVLKWSFQTTVVFDGSEKNWERTTCQSDSMTGKVKKFRFWKIRVENGVETCWPRPYFWSQTLSSRASRKLSIHPMTTFKVLKGPPRLALCFSKKKKNWNVRHTNQILWQEN